ncbi:MAG: transglycosylase SLT domain-containing protein, partial [Mycobacteriales bacterium]
MSPFGWLWNHTDGVLIHGGKVLAGKAFGWLAPKGAHAAGGGAKLLLSHLSLAQLWSVLLVILALMWQALLGFFPQLDRTVHGFIHPSAYVDCAPLPAGGVEGVGYRLGGDLHRLTGPAPTPEQIRGGLLALADGAGRLIGSFQAGVNGGTAPAGPAVLPPAQQVAAPSACCAPPAGTTPASSTDTAAVVAAKAAIAAGFPAAELVTAVAVAGAESGWNPSATHVNSNGSIDRGEWQINSVHADLLRLGDWRDPLTNAR